MSSSKLISSISINFCSVGVNDHGVGIDFSRFDVNTGRNIYANLTKINLIHEIYANELIHIKLICDEERGAH